MQPAQKKLVFFIQIAMVAGFNLFIVAFLSWFFYMIHSAHQIHESTGPGTAIAFVAVPIASILFWAVNYTAYGLLKDEMAYLFGHADHDETPGTPIP